jgi:hypothetical protein
MPRFRQIGLLQMISRDARAASNARPIRKLIDMHAQPDRAPVPLSESFLNRPDRSSPARKNVAAFSQLFLRYGGQHFVNNERNVLLRLPEIFWNGVSTKKLAQTQ